MAAWAALVGRRRVEQGLHGRQFMPLLTEIKAPAKPFFVLIRRHARSADARIQIAADRENDITNALSFQTTDWPSPQELIVRIDSGI